MLRYRLLAGTSLSAVLALVLWADCRWLRDSLLLHGLFVVGAYFAFKELWALCRANGLQTFSHWGTLSGCAMLALHYWMVHRAGRDQPLAAQLEARDLLDAALVIAVLGTFVLTTHRQKLEASLGGLGVTCFGLIYIWFLPSFVLRLRHLGQDGLLDGQNWNEFGTRMVIATIVIAKGCDVCAYLVGRWLGKRKAFPLLSPGKTVAGVTAGLLGSIALAWLLHWQYLDILPAAQFGPFATTLFGLLVGFAGMMGDLSESLLKRSAGVKDASQLVPGYGGVLDVMDSLVVAGPVAYFLTLTILSR